MKKRIAIITLAVCLAAAPLWAGQLQDKIKGVIAKSAAAPAIPTATAHWYVENNLTDETGNHNGTAVGALAYSNTLYIQGSYSVTIANGTWFYAADHADFGPGSDADWSFSCWFRSTWSGATNAIVSKQQWDGGLRGLRVYLDSGDSFQLKIISATAGGEVTIDTNTAISTDTWYHLVIAHDASAANEITIWLSTEAGTFGDAINGTGYNNDYDLVDNTGVFYLGYEQINGDFLRGTMDDIRFWSGTALNATQAQALYDLY